MACVRARREASDGARSSQRAPATERHVTAQASQADAQRARNAEPLTMGTRGETPSWTKEGGLTNTQELARDPA